MSLRKVRSERAASDEIKRVLAATQQELERLRQDRQAREQRETKLTASLASIQADLERGTAQLNERSRRIRREQFTSAVLMFENIRNVFLRIRASENITANLQQSIREDPQHPQRREIEAAINGAEERLSVLRLANRANFQHYVETIYALAAIGTDAAESAGRAVAERFEARRLTIFTRAQASVSAHVDEAIKAGGAVSQSRLDQWLKVISGA